MTPQSQSAPAAPDSQSQPAGAPVNNGGHERGIDALLARALPVSYREEWTGLIAEREAEKGQDATSIFIFRLGQEWMALPTHRVQKVVRGAPPHTIPHRAGILLGLISVQGELVVCISLAHLLKVESQAGRAGAKAAEGQGYFIVAAGEEGPVAFPVDETQGVYRYHQAELREVPSTLAEATASFTTAVLPWKQQVVGCLDDQLLFYAVNKSLS